ncbi:hypothetical protein KL86SPO_60001 [uncultured Sporomusa sp.]|uniref:Uncharacterized protein n=1 Tax=uncultured Sporomusa sp. TaxID=307249 RepID=A0A212M068_9FIRM|nr:hypothetical protein KL86SPO_60001 [uncultured Sporomusa sp.]
MQGSANKGKIKSDYQSVTEQAGIYAGEGGFDINVGKNTDLKGAVISSEATPDKNRISTDTLTWSDIENKAEYSASSVGVNLDTRKNAEKKDAGLTPDIGIPVSGDASSTTQSAIAPGTIEMRSNPDQDLSDLSRDPSGALNALGQIFDKKTVQERQELAKVFGEVAFKEIGDYALRMQEKATTPEEKAKWADGGEYKVFLHTVAGGLMAQLGGGSFTSGAMGAAVNEAVQKALAEKFKDNPAMHQWASAVLGAAAAKVVGGNAQTGASTAVSGTKNNALDPAHILQTIKENPVLSAALLFAGYVVDQQNRIVNKSGEVIASWSESAGGWVDSAGDFVGNTVDSIVLWAKGDSSRSKPKEYGTPNSTEVVRGADGKVEKYTVYGLNRNGFCGHEEWLVQ